MKSVATITFGILSSIGLVAAGLFVSTVIANSADASALNSADATDLWTNKPTVINVSEQSLKREPPRYSTYVVQSDEQKLAIDERQQRLFVPEVEAKTGKLQTASL